MDAPCGSTVFFGPSPKRCGKTMAPLGDRRGTHISAFKDAALDGAAGRGRNAGAEVLGLAASAWHTASIQEAAVSVVGRRLSFSLFVALSAWAQGLAPALAPVAIGERRAGAARFPGRRRGAPQMAERRGRLLKREIGRARQRPLGEFLLFGRSAPRNPGLLGFAV